MNNPEESLTPEKKSADYDTPAQTDSPAGQSISTADNVEIQRHFNELRGELLDKRAVSIDRWLSVIAIVLTFFGVVVAVAGYIGFTRFREIETEAKGYVKDAERLVEEIKNYHYESAMYLDSIKTVTAEIVANNPEKAKQIAANVGENTMASLTDKAIAQAVFLQQENKKDEAIEKWRAVAHIAKGIDNDLAARAWFSVGYLLRDENSESCVLANDEAIRLKPDFAEAYNNRGVAKAALGQRAEAITDFDEAIRLKPDFAEAYYNRGITKAELGHHKDAIADYDEAIRLKPDYAKAYNNRGVEKAALGQRTEAIADYDEAIRLKPDFAEAYYNRGNAKAALDLIDEARQNFEKARDLARDAGNDSLADMAEQRLRGLNDSEDE